MNRRSPRKAHLINGGTLMVLEKVLLQLQSKCGRTRWSKPNEPRLVSCLEDISEKIDEVNWLMDSLLRVEFDVRQYGEWAQGLGAMRAFQEDTRRLADHSRDFLKELMSVIEHRDSAPKDSALGFSIRNHCGSICYLAGHKDETLSKQLSAFGSPEMMKIASIADDARKELMLTAGHITKLSGSLVTNGCDELVAPLNEVALLMEDLQFNAVDRDAATLLSKCRECPWFDLQDDRLLPFLGDMERRITGLRSRMDAALIRDVEEDEMGELWAFRRPITTLACNTSDALHGLIFAINANDFAGSNRAILEDLSRYRGLLGHRYGPEENALDEELSALPYEDPIKLRSYARKVRDVIMTVGECIGGVYDRAYDSLGDMALPSGSGTAHDDELLRTSRNWQTSTLLPEEEPAYYHVSPYMAANRIDIDDDFENDLGLEGTKLLPSYEELQCWTDRQDAEGQLLSPGLRTPMYATGAFSGSRRTSLPPRGGVVDHGDGYYHYEEDEVECDARAYIDGGWHAETGQENPSMGLPTSHSALYTSEMDETWLHCGNEASFDSHYPHSTSPVYNNYGSSYAYMPTEYNDEFFHSRPLAELINGLARSRLSTEYNREPFHGYIDGEVYHSDDERNQGRPHGYIDGEVYHSDDEPNQGQPHGYIEGEVFQSDDER